MRRIVLLVVFSTFALIQTGTADEPKETRQEAVVRLMNEFRIAEKVATLKTNDTLTKLAQAHTDNMAKQDKYGDDDKDGHVLDGKSAKDRVDAIGYKYAAFGENVHMNFGYSDPVKVAMDEWKKSEGHRKNLLNDAYTETGVGIAQGKSGKWYFCQVFAKPAAGK